MDSTTQTINSCDYPIILCLAEHKGNELADALEDREDLLGSHVALLILFLSLFVKLFDDPPCNLRLVCYLKVLSHLKLMIK
jgi:hypothetical protein